MKKTGSGSLIIIGGHEDKSDGDREILKTVAKAVPAQGQLLILTVATQEPEETAAEYVAVFKELGARNVDVLHIRSREDAKSDAAVEKVSKASVYFFTGGDQLRITSQLCDSPTYQCIEERY